MPTRRTTIAADEDDLATLEAEAKRRGTALTTVVAEAISEKAAALRARRRPTPRRRTLHGRPQRRSRRIQARGAPTALTALICDTGPLLAALDAAATDHESCADLLTSATEDLRWDE